MSAPDVMTGFRPETLPYQVAVPEELQRGVEVALAGLDAAVAEGAVAVPEALADRNRGDVKQFAGGDKLAMLG
jgi:hypothetical protein